MQVGNLLVNLKQIDIVMPLIKQKPSFNHEVIRDMTLKELIAQHPLADEEWVKSEWEKAGGKEPAKQADAKKE